MSSKSFYLHIATIIVTYLPISMGTCPIVCKCTGNDLLVNCQDSRLSSLPNGIQDNVTELKMSNNLFMTLEDSTLSRFSNLIKLDFSKNRLTAISGKALHGLTSLSDLDLSENNLLHLDSVTFDNSTNLNVLNLRSNSIGSLPKEFFQNCHQLANIFLANNSLTEDIFSTLNAVTSLQNLDLSYNVILQVPYLSLHRLSKLQNLILHDNGITTVDSNAFIGLDNLLFLSLSSNSIKHLSREMFQPISPSHVTVSTNPVACTCSTKQFQDWVKESGTSLDKDSKCTNPEDGAVVDIENGALDHLCKGDVLEVCQPSANITLYVNHLTGGDTELTWTTFGIYENLTFDVKNRIFGLKESEWIIKVDIKSQRIILKNMTKDTAVISCAEVNQCNLRSCVDYETDKLPLPSVQCPQIGLILGGTLGGVSVVILVFLVVSILIGRCREKSKFSMTEPDRQENTARPYVNCNGVANTNRQDLTEDVYEAIPAAGIFDPYRLQGAFENESYVAESQCDMSSFNERMKKRPIIHEGNFQRNPSNGSEYMQPVGPSGVRGKNTNQNTKLALGDNRPNREKERLDNGFDLTPDGEIHTYEEPKENGTLKQNGKELKHTLGKSISQTDRPRLALPTEQNKDNKRTKEISSNHKKKAIPANLTPLEDITAVRTSQRFVKMADKAHTLSGAKPCPSPRNSPKVSRPKPQNITDSRPQELAHYCTSQLDELPLGNNNQMPLSVSGLVNSMTLPPQKIPRFELKVNDTAVNPVQVDQDIVYFEIPEDQTSEMQV